MNLTHCSAKDYENKSASLTMAKQSQTNPNKANFTRPIV
jgi:hypothetical protein